MNNSEFNKLSQEQVKKTNGSTNEESYQSWRAGYMYLVNQIRLSFENDYNDEFMQKMEDISESDFEVVNFEALANG